MPWNVNLLPDSDWYKQMKESAKKTIDELCDTSLERFNSDKIENEKEECRQWGRPFDDSKGRVTQQDIARYKSAQSNMEMRKKNLSDAYAAYPVEPNDGDVETLWNVVKENVKLMPLKENEYISLNYNSEDIKRLFAAYLEPDSLGLMYVNDSTRIGGPYYTCAKMLMRLILEGDCAGPGEIQNAELKKLAADKEASDRVRVVMAAI